MDLFCISFWERAYKKRLESKGPFTQKNKKQNLREGEGDLTNLLSVAFKTDLSDDPTYKYPVLSFL